MILLTLIVFKITFETCKELTLGKLNKNFNPDYISIKVIAE